MIVNLEAAIDLLNKGSVVGIPTETVYGLAARIDNESALKKIFATKQRPFFDPLIVHVADPQSARTLAQEWPPIYDVLAEAFWPGPLTLICEKRESVSPLITAGLSTVALRVPRHPMALEIIRKVGCPLAAPSANRFGRTSPTTAQHVEHEFAGQVAVINGGSSEVGLESTVLRAELKGDSWLVEILRPGGVNRAMIRKVLKTAGLRADVVRAQSSISPGHLKEHYQPTQPLIILDGVSLEEINVEQISTELGRPPLRAVEMKLSVQPFEAARILYNELRQLSVDAKNMIVIKRLPEHTGEDWEAVWDRLERAASKIIKKT